MALARMAIKVERGWGYIGEAPRYCIVYFGLNNIYFEKLSHTNLQTEQSGFGRKLQACKDHLPIILFILDAATVLFRTCPSTHLTLKCITKFQP